MKTTKIIITPEMTVSEINEIIKEAADNSSIYFEKGEYYMNEVIAVNGKKDFVMYLAEAVFRPYFNSGNGDHVPTDSIDVFHFEDCDNLEIYGGIIKSATPPHVPGKVTAVTDEYLEIMLFPKTPLTGNEKFVHGRTLDEQGRPCGGYIHDYVPNSKRYELVKNDRIIFAKQLACTNHPFCNMEVEFVEENLCRIRNIHKGNFRVGMDCTLGYVYYGNCAFVFTACKNVLMDGTRFCSFGGMGVVILPDSRDFTFRNVVIKSDDNNFSTEPLQSDGIHIAGCGGKLVLDSCYWEYTIDDALNAHAQLLTVTESKNGNIKLIYDKLFGRVLKHWATVGDVLRVYDVNTKLFKGTVNVISAGEDTAVTDAAEKGIEINPGDFITNSAHFCDFYAKNCKLFRCTGSFKIRSVNSAHIRDCIFDGSRKSIVMSVSFAKTKEGGLVKDIVIEHNRFLNSGYEPSIYSGVYSGDIGEFRHLHKNITIRNNYFANSTAKTLIELTATDGVVIEDNVMINCKNTFMEFSNCNDVVCRNNKTE